MHQSYRITLAGLALLLAATSARADPEILKFSRCWAFVGGQTWDIEYGYRSGDECRQLALQCTGNARAEVTWNSNGKWIKGNWIPCPQQLPQKPAFPPPPPPPSATVVRTPTKLVPGQWGERRYVFSYGPLRSGEFTAHSPPYTLCGDAPQDHRIVSHAFELDGDRQCFKFATCDKTTDTTEQVCYKFTLQGHGERHLGVVPVVPNDGVRHSTGVLAFSVIHAKCLRSSQVVRHSADDDFAKAPLNDAPCFTHAAYAGAGKDIDALYRFRVPVPGRLFLRLYGQQTEFALQLLAQDGSRLAPATVINSRNPQTLEYVVTAPGVYGVRAQPTSGPSNYEIDLSFTPN